jgi:hypothetical protein
MDTRFLVMTTAMFAITFACPAAADTDASILNDTFFGIGGPPSEAYPADSGRSIGSGSWRTTALWGAPRPMMSR